MWTIPQTIIFYWKRTTEIFLNILSNFCLLLAMNISIQSFCLRRMIRLSTWIYWKHVLCIKRARQSAAYANVFLNQTVTHFGDLWKRNNDPKLLMGETDRVSLRALPTETDKIALRFCFHQQWYCPIVLAYLHKF